MVQFQCFHSKVPLAEQRQQTSNNLSAITQQCNLIFYIDFHLVIQSYQPFDLIKA